jgi:hypothetical protein
MIGEEIAPVNTAFSKQAHGTDNTCDFYFSVLTPNFFFPASSSFPWVPFLPLASPSKAF